MTLSLELYHCHVATKLVLAVNVTVPPTHILLLPVVIAIEAVGVLTVICKTPVAQVGAPTQLGAFGVTKHA